MPPDCSAVRVVASLGTAGVDQFHRRETAKPPTLREIYAENHKNRERCAMTVDLFSDWNSMAHGLPLNDLWPKIHPHMDMTEVFDQLDSARSRYNTEIYKVTDLVTPHNAAGK